MATALMPSSLQAQMTRSAISPRFATRIFLNMKLRLASSGQDHAQLLFAYAEQRHSVLDRVSVRDKRFGEHTRDLRLDLVHQLHGFNDAQHLSLLYRIADLDEGRRTRRRGFVEGTDDG